MQHNDYILTLSCPDRTGIVYRVSGLLFELGCNILDSQHSATTKPAASSCACTSTCRRISSPMLRARLDTLSAEFGMDLQLHDARRKARLLIMVSKQGHCLNDLLFRVHSGQLRRGRGHRLQPQRLRAAGGHLRHPFHHLPVTPDTKAQQEQQVLDLAAREHIDLVVLARYMQILSADMCRALNGRAINIHHSFLPSFKGARPYHQAHARGVKIIGATAHYVTSDLDEGPIIDQDIERVDHTMTAADLTQVGSDIESLVLSRAVQPCRTPHPAEPQQDRRLPLIARIRPAHRAGSGFAPSPIQAAASACAPSPAASRFPATACGPGRPDRLADRARLVLEADEARAGQSLRDRQAGTIATPSPCDTSAATLSQ